MGFLDYLDKNDNILNKKVSNFSKEKLIKPKKIVKNKVENNKYELSEQTIKELDKMGINVKQLIQNEINKKIVLENNKKNINKSAPKKIIKKENENLVEHTFNHAINILDGMPNECEIDLSVTQTKSVVQKNEKENGMINHASMLL